MADQDFGSGGPPLAKELQQPADTATNFINRYGLPRLLALLAVAYMVVFGALVMAARLHAGAGIF